MTLGRSARGEHLLVAEDALAARGGRVHEVARGGDVTYHAPGQLVGYPIVDLAARDARDVHAWLRTLEELVGEALLVLGVPWRRVPGWTGVFVDTPRPRAAQDRVDRRRRARLGHAARLRAERRPRPRRLRRDRAMRTPAVEMTSIARELGARAPADLAARVRGQRPRPRVRFRAARPRSVRIPAAARCPARARTRAAAAVCWESPPIRVAAPPVGGRRRSCRTRRSRRR